MSLLETVSTAEIWVAEDSPTAGAGGRFIRYGTLQSVSIDTSSNDSLDETFEGTVFTRGRGRSSISFDSIIPMAGKRIDFVRLITRHAQVRVVAVVADKKRTYQGIIQDDAEKFGLNKPATDNVKLMCGEPVYEDIP